MDWNQIVDQENNYYKRFNDIKKIEKIYLEC